MILKDIDKNKLRTILDYCILALTGIYLSYMTLTMTMFEIDFPELFKLAIFGLMCIVAGLRVILIGLRDWRLWAAAAFAAVYFFVYFFSDYPFFLFIAVMTVGLIDVDWRKVLIVYVVAVGVPVAAAVIAAQRGIIENLVRYKDEHPRYSMGMTYPTDFASMVLCLGMFFWASWRKLPDWLGLFLAAGSVYVSYYICYSRTSVLCGALFAAAVVMRLIDRWLISRAPRLQNVLDWGMALLFAVVAGAMAWLLRQYISGEEWAKEADLAMSNRLILATQALKAYGVHPFGSNFELIGFGKSTGWVAGYNFIDPTYYLIPIRYGWVTLITVFAGWAILIRRCRGQISRKLIFVMLVLAVHAISEHHYIEVDYNIALIMPFAAFNTNT